MKIMVRALFFKRFRTKYIQRLVWISSRQWQMEVDYKHSVYITYLYKYLFESETGCYLGIIQITAGMKWNYPKQTECYGHTSQNYDHPQNHLFYA